MNKAELNELIEGLGTVYYDSKFDFLCQRIGIKPDSYAHLIVSEKWNLIREAYSVSMPTIIKNLAAGKRTCPYILDWHQFFTPIEEMVWGDIRFMGLPFYPQVPVLNYFIDFADPYKKIGIEVDGKRFHDPIKDKIRDNNLEKIGWVIFRIKGAYTFKSREDFMEEGEEDESKLHNYLTMSSEGIIYSIRNKFYTVTQEEFNEEDR